MNDTPSATAASNKAGGLLLANVVLNAVTLLIVVGVVGFGLGHRHHPMGGPGHEGFGGERWGMHERFGPDGPGEGRFFRGRPESGRDGFGGGREGEGERAPGEHRLDRLAAVLSLTPDQQAKIAALVEAQRTKATDETRAQIRALLTPDQQKKFDALPKPPGA